MRATAGDAARLYSDPLRKDDLRDTELMSSCPRIAAELRRFECPLGAVRLLRLAAGSVIREHCDDNLRLEDGEARLHVPLTTNDDVEFYVDNVRVIMEPGECWYLNLSLPHRVQNRGSLDRIHLVIDCGVNDWLIAQIEAGTPVERRARASARRAAASRTFRERVLRRSAVAGSVARRATIPPHSRPGAVELGAAHGFAFDAEDVRAAMTRGAPGMGVAMGAVTRLGRFDAWLPIRVF